MTIRCLTDFLGDYPLYKEYEAITGYQRGPEGYTHPFDLDGQTFNYLCPKENQLKVFVLNSTMEYIDFWKDTIWEESISPSLLDVDGKLNFIHYYEGKCTSCKEMHAGFLLHVYSKEPIPKEKVSFAFSSPESDPFYNKEINIYIEKVGEYPKKEILVTKDFVKYFDR